MTGEELKNKGAIYFENISIGLNQYQDEKKVMNEEEALGHFQKLIRQYGQENSYVDFYYYRLDKNAQHIIENALTEGEQDYLERIRPEEGRKKEEEIIFPLSEDLLKIVIKLNAREILFSTIYFIAPPEAEYGRSTWWGNYNQEYICFTEKRCHNGSGQNQQKGGVPFKA